MSSRDEKFLLTLRATFRVEAAEHLQVIATGLLELEKAPSPAGQRTLIETMFRAAHSLKGAARAVDFTEIESSCQSLEDTLAVWRQDPPAPAEFDTAHRTLDAITAVMSAPEASVDGRPPDAKPHVAQLGGPPEGAGPLPAGVAPPAPATAQTDLAADETVRITVAKLDARLVEAEKMLTAKLTTGQRAGDLRDLTQRFSVWRKEGTAIEPDWRALRQAIERPPPGHTGAPASPGLSRLLDFFEWNREFLKSLEDKVAALTRTAEQDHREIGKLVDDLLTDSKKLLLLPFSTLAVALPKLVRDLCRDQGKEADLVIRGGEVEVDKRILEEMKDPLIHLLRNCVDHGIENPESRVHGGKPARATITLAISPVNGSKIEILVADDGTGIDTAKVKASAVKHGFLTATEADQMSDPKVWALIFQSEVSTSRMITRMSGRGLGLAIVRERAEKLGGSVTVDSRPQQGTEFRILLPRMLATFRGILIEVAARRFVVPTFHVERVARVTVTEVQTVEGRETIVLGGRAVALVRMAEVLSLPPANSTGETIASRPVLILGLGDQRMAFMVDAVLDEQEVLVKPLRRPLSRVRHIAGATVLGSGHVAPILNVADLLKSARKTGGAAGRVESKAKPADAKSLLVAEDSISSRTLIKGILESAGYTVKTAVDGMEAFTLLRTESFDLIVSDVEMPRLNGFDLTARIRADRKLAELPVVLVTAREKREDRERGIEVGASAYLIKSSFDQSDLLAAVRRLVG